MRMVAFGRTYFYPGTGNLFSNFAVLIDLKVNIECLYFWCYHLLTELLAHEYSSGFSAVKKLAERGSALA